jgi:tRNA dimethylallyltransferase
VTGRPLALVGPTASGKSALALDVARRLGDVELVCADAMTVYRGMDLGTAKPSADDRRSVAHHLLDVVDPAEEFTVGRYRAEAQRAVDDIDARGRRTLLVGGTGLYVRAVVDRLDVPGRWPALARRLDEEAAGPGGASALHARLAELDPVAAGRMEPSNRRRVVRALEVTLGSGRPFSSFGPGLDRYGPTDFVLVGVPLDRPRSDRRIAERFSTMLDAGLLEEVRTLAARPGGLSRTARQALGYRELLDHLERGTPLADAHADAVRRTRALARRQWAWFRRDPRIHWLDPDGDRCAQVLALWADGARDDVDGVNPGGTSTGGTGIGGARAEPAPVGSARD